MENHNNSDEFGAIFRIPEGKSVSKNLLPEEDYIGSYAYQEILILFLEITAY